MRYRNAVRAAVITSSFTYFLCDQSQGAAEEHEHPVPEKLGSVEFPISCSSQAEKGFQRAMALLHSFAYSAAEKAFSDVIKSDPNCAMAHWGIAMTYFHQLWEPPIAPQNMARGEAELKRAKELGGSERERELIDALTLVYANAGSVPYQEPLGRYASAMSKIAERYRDNAECQIFYALALIATAPANDTKHSREKEAAAILERLVQRYPQHPGIAHYLIHACDNSEMANRAVVAAQAYSQIAPSAPHALHMPSHIYTRLGMWEESIGSNRAARTAAQEQGDKGEELHAMDYLTYAYLQLGRDAEAARLVSEVRSMSGLDESDFKVGYAASAMPARYAIERREWNEAAQLVPLEQAQPQTLATTLWARSVGLARGGNPKAAEEEIEKLKRAYNKLRTDGNEYWATQVHLLVDEALAWARFAQGKPDEALRLMRSAADEDDAIEKRPVTPGSIVPAREQLGDLLLEMGRPTDAVQEFKKSLAQTPQRRGALNGISRASAVTAK